MSSEDPNQLTSSAETPALSLIPTAKKKQTKTKPRIRPTLKKVANPVTKKSETNKSQNGSISREDQSGGAIASTQQNTSQNLSESNEKTITNVEGTSSTVPSDKDHTIPKASSNAKADTVRKVPIRKPIRPKASGTKKGLSISIGSSIPQRPLHEGHTAHISDHGTLERVVESTQASTQNEVALVPVPTSTVRAAPTTTTTTGTTTTSSIAAEESSLVPYQHLGQLDPSLNIPPPKEGEKTMKAFCSNFKIPKEARAASRPTSKANELASAPPPPPEDEKDERSAPFVEIINGEIVIKESSMIVGGRRTTEEVDRELEGAVVEEENEGITATYNSFTKRQKTSRWTVEETKNFFLALRQCGTDFSTMESFFTGEDGTTKRTRKQLKSKYLRETKKNLKLIDMAMNPAVQLPMDLSVFGELDMDAVKDTVVPLGQATPSPAPLNIVSKSGKKRKASLSPSVITQTQDDEMEEIVEDASEELREEVIANEKRNTVAQDDVPAPANNPEKDPIRSTETVDTTTESPLVVPIMKPKKQQRPKFRVKAKPNPSKSLKAKTGKK